jgi:hypothetical protein
MAYQKERKIMAKKSTRKTLGQFKRKREWE